MATIERVSEIIKAEDLKVSVFEKRCGLSNNSIRVAIQRGAQLKEDTINSILNAFPKYSPEWLLTGNGPRFRSDLAEYLLKDIPSKEFSPKNDNAIENETPVEWDGNNSASVANYDDIPLFKEENVHYNKSSNKNPETEKQMEFLKERIRHLESELSTKDELISSLKTQIDLMYLALNSGSSKKKEANAG